MSDSIEHLTDRVFVKAISTIRALSTRTGYGSLPRPPVESRIRLYGLYKQATEGNVEGIMTRPQGFRPEDESAKRKWDAWKEEEGLSKTEAKRRYISFLIETMKVYASGTHEARELLSELEYLWDQIKDINPSPSPPITPLIANQRYSSQNSVTGSVYAGSNFNEAYNDSLSFLQGGLGSGVLGASTSNIRNELRDVQLLKKEVQLALRRINDELNVSRGKKDDTNYEYPWLLLKKIGGWLYKVIGAVGKRLIIDLLVTLIIIKLIKYKRGVDVDLKGQNKGVLNKILYLVFRLLNNANLISFNKVHINIE